MFARLGRLVTNHPWRVIAVWVIAVALIVPFSPSLADVSNADQASFIPDDNESVQAQQLAEQAFPTTSGTTAIMVVKRADGAQLTPAGQAEVGALAQDLMAARIPRVAAVVTGPEQVAPNGGVHLLQVVFQGALLRLVSPRQAKQVTADSWRQIAKASSSKVTAMRRITGASTASS